MKLVAQFVAATLVATTAGAGEAKTDQASLPNAVTVCISSSGNIVIAAQAGEIAKRMFAKIDVTLIRRGKKQDCPAGGILVSLNSNTPEGLLPQALAYALPFQGTQIKVFFDRIHQTSLNYPGLEPVLLAHVLAHEIAHMLQGTNCHSDIGLMKAVWNPDDYANMMIRGLAFTPEEAASIKRGISARAAHYNSGTYSLDRDHGPFAF